MDADHARARSVARQSGMFRLSGSPYIANLRRLGYTDDLADGPSDRVIDATFACGDEATIAARVREHLDAGADHVVVQPLGPNLPTLLDQLESLSDHLP
jgi:alkanesulfonate monooxygenase SsuD/methylene tetrahydromethanopterin reductase-like flavin-dependent oxidoreductase (luciferase family)